MLKSKIINHLAWILLLTVSSECLLSQQSVCFRGMVTDATTGEALPYANVALLPARLGIGVTTGDDGRYLLCFNARPEGIICSYVGYEPQIVRDLPENGILDFRLKQSATELEDVVVAGRRTRYRNRDNPAVELIRRVIANKDKNSLESRDTYEYTKYEKMLFSINELNDSIKNNILFRKFPFLADHIDTCKETGYLSIPVFFRENISNSFYRKSPEASKEYLVARKMVNPHDFIDQDAMSTFVDGMAEKTNLYDNKIMILDNEYLSPLSPASPQFYRFHILDTVPVSGISCINLSVYPRNPQDFGFRGNLYITNDSACVLKRAELSFTRNTNVNFVNNFSLIQEYTCIDSTWCLTFDEVTMDLGIIEKKNMVSGKRTNLYQDYRFDHPLPDHVFSGKSKTESLPGFDLWPDQYWVEKRPAPLTRAEQGTYDMIDAMKKDRWFRHILELAGLIYSGYLDAGKIDIGPVSTLISFNEIEGLRLRFGGKTNARFNKHLFFEGYAAYGFKDEKFKFRVGTMYSFNERKLYPWEFPMNLISLSYENNIETPGHFYQSGSTDRLLLSFHRGHARQMVYHRTFNMQYDKEYLNGFSFRPSFTQRTETPAGNLIYAGEEGIINSITTTQVGLKLRFAPNERFYQIQSNRYSLNHINPVLTLDYSYGIKDFFKGDYEFNRLEVTLDKRTWFASLGFTDLQVKAGKVWGKVPFPLLIIHQANQSYTFQDNAFNLMNYMEFVSDRYAQVNVSHCFNSWIFNRIPLIKKLKWREIISFKAVWGSVDGRNTPGNDSGLLFFPVNEEGIPVTYALSGKPYMEVGAAIDNIFKILRIDVARRINYLDHPDVPKWGIGFMLRFMF